MKRSELRQLIREVLSEALPEIFSIISEIVEENNNKPIVAESNRIDLSSIKAHVNNSITDRGYGEMGVDLPKPSIQPKPYAIPNNPKGIVNGEKYVSGKGIMEWLEKTGGPVRPTTEFKHTESQIEDFINKKFGQK